MTKKELLEALLKRMRLEALLALAFYSEPSEPPQRRCPKRVDSFRCERPLDHQGPCEAPRTRREVELLGDAEKAIASVDVGFDFIYRPDTEDP